MEFESSAADGTTAHAAVASAVAALVALPQAAAAAAADAGQHRSAHTGMSIAVSAETMLTECACGLCIAVSRCIARLSSSCSTSGLSRQASM
jgi:hypothetical protein